MSKDPFDPFPLTKPSGWDLIVENAKNVKFPEPSGPFFTDEQAEQFSKFSELAARSLASVPPEVFESFQLYKDHFEKLSKSLSISKNLGEKRTKKAEEIAQEIFDESSEDFKPLLQMTQEGIATASELDWSEIKDLEANEEIPATQAEKLKKNSLFSLIKEKLHKLDPHKITKSDAYEWAKIFQMILTLINNYWNLIEKIIK